MKQIVRHNPTSETALVVGDDPALRRLTATILRQQGFRVIEVRAMAEAREFFGTEHTSIILLVASLDARIESDVLTAVLTLNRQHPELRAVLTSASSPDALDLELMRATGIQFLSLPYSFARFSRAIASFTGVDRNAALEILPGVMSPTPASTEPCAAFR